MTSGGTWGTRPFRPEALESAREAARRSGLSLREWVNAAILDTAAGARVRAQAPEFIGEDIAQRIASEAIGENYPEPVERLGELARRIDRLVKRTEPIAVTRSTAASPAPELSAAMQTIGDRLEAILREIVPQSQAATERLANAVAELTGRLDQFGAERGPVAPDARSAWEGATDRVPNSAPPRTDDKESPELSLAVAEISNRQRELDAELAATQDFSRLEQQLRNITDQIETLRQPAHTPERAADIIDRLGLDRIESRLAELSTRLDDRAAAAEGIDRTRFDAIERRIAELSAKLDRPASEIIDRSIFDGIESRMAELAARLENSDARLESLGTIERCLADVMLELKETQAAAAEEAHRAAAALATELRAENGAAGIAIDVLKQELAEFRIHQAEIEHRTEDALEAVHTTLERLIDRFAEVESAARAAPRFADPPAAPTTADLRAVANLMRPAAPSAIPPVGAPAPQSPASATRSELPPDHPLEPGSGPPSRVAPAEGSASPAAGTEPASKASFIAAARRAAQAAAAETSDRPETKESGGEASAIGAGIASRRRPFMIAAAILLFGAGGVHVALNGKWLPFPALFEAARTHLAAAENARAALLGDPSAWIAQDSPTAAPPDPLVPETASSVRRPASTASAAAAVAPIAEGGGAATSPPTQTGIPARAPSPAVKNDVTGALPATQAKPQGGAAAPQLSPVIAESLPSAIGTLALRSAALAGNPAAQYEIGVRFSDGRGVPQNFEQAAMWLARAADQGLAPAQYRLGSLREKGQGIKKDFAEARRLYLAAAQQGNGKAMHNLAVLYAVGPEGGPDYKAAADWFRKAAEHGLADSQYNLGILCARGIGAEQNLPEAYKWFALAAQQGDEDAAKKRDDVAARLDQQSLASAQSAVQTWTAQPQPENAVKVEAPDGDWDRAPVTGPSAQNKSGRRAGNTGPV